MLSELKTFKIQFAIAHVKLLAVACFLGDKNLIAKCLEHLRKKKVTIFNAALTCYGVACY